MEESFEALDAESGELIGELADVQEVIAGICEALQIPVDQVEAERADKHKRRGGFEEGIMLTETSTPHSLPPEKQPSDQNRALSSDECEDAIERPSEIPSSRPYSRPDLRSVDRQPEGLLTFETELNRIGNAGHSAIFEIPLTPEEFREFKLLVKLTRKRSTLWGQVRLRLEPAQIAIGLDQMELFPDENPVADGS